MYATVVPSLTARIATLVCFKAWLSIKINGFGQAQSLEGWAMYTFCSTIVNGQHETNPLRPVYSDTTQLDVELSWVASLYRHHHRRNSTVADDRQCNWPSWTAYIQSARSRSVELSWVELRRRRYRHFADATSATVELSCVAINGPLVNMPLTFYSAMSNNMVIRHSTLAIDVWAGLLHVVQRGRDRAGLKNRILSTFSIIASSATNLAQYQRCYR